MGDWIWLLLSGRPFGISAVAARDSRRVDDEDLELLDLEEEDDLLELEDLLEEELELLEEDLDEEEEDLLETSRMFRTRPVVGSVVEDSEGLWETW